MADEVQKTDTKGESKTEELNLSELFNPPKAEDATDEKGVDKVIDNDDETPSPGESESDDPKELKTKLAALTKELTRVRKGKSESSAEVQEVREQLANLQGQLDVMSKGKPADEAATNGLAKYTDDQLLQGQTEWEDLQVTARGLMTQARKDQDEDAYEKAAQKLNTAKATLTGIRKELHERTKRVGSEQARAQSEASDLVQEITGLYENAYETLPDLKDKDSDLWKAGNEVYNRHPKLMKQLGPMAELVATSIALSENPKLLPAGKSNKEARKDLLKEINDKVDKSLIKGSSTPNKKTVTDFNAMPKDQFEKLIHTLKRG